MDAQSALLRRLVIAGSARGFARGSRMEKVEQLDVRSAATCSARRRGAKPVAVSAITEGIDELARRSQKMRFDAQTQIYG